MIAPAILDAIGHLGERKVIALPPRLRQFVHNVIVLPTSIDPPARADTFATSPVGRCESPEGQLVCSCGMFALAWSDPAP